MAKAVASGMPKMKIEESSARRQARIDSGSGKKLDQEMGGQQSSMLGERGGGRRGRKGRR